MHLPTVYFFAPLGPLRGPIFYFAPLQRLTPLAWKNYRSRYRYGASGLQNVKFDVLQGGAKREI